MSAIKTALAVTATLSVPVAMSTMPGPLETSSDTANPQLLERHFLTQLGVAGRQVYQAHCQDCHGSNGHGTVMGPSLMHPSYDPARLRQRDFHRAVTEGVQARLWDYGDMPAVQLSFNDIELVSRYLRELRDPARYVP